MFGLREAGLVNYGNRPEGFYSNALTLAYTMFLLFPLTINSFLKHKNIYWGLAVLCVTISLIVNNSRMVLAVATLLTSINIFLCLKGRLRNIVLCLGLTIGTLTLVTDNPISNRLDSLLKQSENVTYKGYADHRLVFWSVYIDIIKDGPFFGHGPRLNTDFHTPYYRARGFGDFEKKFSAHNQFLQVAGNAGLVGLFFFLCWITLLGVNIWKNIEDKTLRAILLQSLIGFMLAATTQNAFQDAEVRQALMLMCIFTVAHSSQTPKTKAV